MFSATVSLEDILDKVYESPPPEENFQEIKQLLLLEDEAAIKCLFSYADKVRERFMGGGILLRGIVEFSNYCGNTCFYCGLNRHNAALSRYRMSAEEIIDSVSEVSAMNIKTVVLQSGEEDRFDPLWLAGLIRKIKEQFALAVTLSVGEKGRDEYKLWRQAGADRYLLKIETTDAQVYAAAHSGRRLESRLRCLDELISLGYQVGSGILIGLRSQTVDSIARDILFFKEKDFDMLGIGPFIPHPRTVFANDAAGNIKLTLKALAVARIVTRNAHMPATTALGSVDGDRRLDGLRAGANVLMPNFTPIRYRRLYEIYPGKVCVGESPKECLPYLSEKAHTVGRSIDYSVGHSVKKRHLLIKEETHE